MYRAPWWWSRCYIFLDVLYEIKDLVKNNSELEKHFPTWISDALLAKYHGTFETPRTIHTVISFAAPQEWRWA